MTVQTGETESDDSLWQEKVVESSKEDADVKAEREVVMEKAKLQRPDDPNASPVLIYVSWIMHRFILYLW